MPRFLAISDNFLIAHSGTIRSPQSTPHLIGLQMFPLTASSSSSSILALQPQLILIRATFSLQGRRFQVGFFLFIRIFHRLLMWSVGRSTIVTPWNGGKIPPPQWDHGSLSLPSSNDLLLTSPLAFRGTGTFLVHSAGFKKVYSSSP